MVLGPDDVPFVRYLSVVDFLRKIWKLLTALKIFQTEISIKNWIVNADNLPPYLPEKKIFINLRFTNKKNSIIEEMNNVTFFFALENS